MAASSVADLKKCLAIVCCTGASVAAGSGTPLRACRINGFSATLIRPGYQVPLMRRSGGPSRTNI
jgi:hypothetical protein